MQEPPVTPGGADGAALRVGWGPGLLLQSGGPDAFSTSPGVLPDKRMEMEKHSLTTGDYSRVVGKGPGTRPQISKESSMDRSPYFDKVRGGGAEVLTLIR